MADPFRLSIIQPGRGGWLDVGHKGFALGSCFAAEVGKRLAADGVQILVNPFGTAYNPVTGLQALTADADWFMARTVRRQNGKVYSLRAHSDVFGSDEEELRQVLERQIAATHGALTTADFILITLGTAWVFALANEPETLCANCHQQPAGLFERRLLMLPEIAAAFSALFSSLEQIRSALPSVIVSVSPVIHGRAALSENSLSKSILRVAADELCRTHTNVIYYPALEIVRDELRDYRFYAEDMQHPSPQATQIVYDRFMAWAGTPRLQSQEAAYRAKAVYAAHRPR